MRSTNSSIRAVMDYAAGIRPVLRSARSSRRFFTSATKVPSCWVNAASIISALPVSRTLRPGPDGRRAEADHRAVDLRWSICVAPRAPASSVPTMLRRPLTSTGPEVPQPARRRTDVIVKALRVSALCWLHCSAFRLNADACRPFERISSYGQEIPAQDQGQRRPGCSTETSSCEPQSVADRRHRPDRGKRQS